MRSIIIFLGLIVIMSGCSTHNVAIHSSQLGYLNDLQEVALKTRNGYYVHAINGGGDNLVSDSKDFTPFTKFTLELIDKEASKVRLRTSEGYYVHAGVRTNVDAIVKVPLTSEVFTLEWVNKNKGTISLKSRDGNYLNPVSGATRNIEATAKTRTRSEVYTLVFLD